MSGSSLEGVSQKGSFDVLVTTTTACEPSSALALGSTTSEPAPSSPSLDASGPPWLPEGGRPVA
eukprot:4996100-Prymnesium_polylepis.1